MHEITPVSPFEGCVKSQIKIPFLSLWQESNPRDSLWLLKGKQKEVTTDCVHHACFLRLVRRESWVFCNSKCHLLFYSHIFSLSLSLFAVYFHHFLLWLSLDIDRVKRCTPCVSWDVTDREKISLSLSLSLPSKYSSWCRQCNHFSLLSFWLQVSFSLFCHSNSLFFQF